MRIRVLGSHVDSDAPCLPEKQYYRNEIYFHGFYQCINIAADEVLFSSKSNDICLISPGKHMLWFSLEAPR